MQLLNSHRVTKLNVDLLLFFFFLTEASPNILSPEAALNQKPPESALLSGNLALNSSYIMLHLWSNQTDAQGFGFKKKEELCSLYEFVLFIHRRKN